MIDQDGLVRYEGGNAYNIYKGLVRIDVVQQDPELVVFKLPKKYCHYAGIKGDDTKKGVAARWHEGFVVLKMERMVEDALLEPLPEEAVRKLLNLPSEGD